MFEALASLRGEGDPAAQARLTFLGPNSDFIHDLAGKFGVEHLVDRHGDVVPHEKALAAQRSASDLLIFLDSRDVTAHELGSKIFEYAGARRPVLAFGAPGSALRDFIARHRLGWFATTLEEAKAALREAHRRFIAGDSEVCLDDGAVLQARDLARSFAAQLDAARV